MRQYIIYWYNTLLMNYVDILLFQVHEPMDELFKIDISSIPKRTIAKVCYINDKIYILLDTLIHFYL